MSYWLLLNLRVHFWTKSSKTMVKSVWKKISLCSCKIIKSIRNNSIRYNTCANHSLIQFVIYMHVKLKRKISWLVDCYQNNINRNSFNNQWNWKIYIFPFPQSTPVQKNRMKVVDKNALVYEFSKSKMIFLISRISIHL